MLGARTPSRAHVLAEHTGCAHQEDARMYIAIKDGGENGSWNDALHVHHARQAGDYATRIRTELRREHD